MCSRPVVSVIITIHNTPEPFLASCIRSVLDQTMQNIEIVLVEVSTSAACPAHKQYAGDQSAIRITHKVTTDPSRARSTGISSARGKYVCFLDGSDYILPKTLQTLYETADRNEAQAVLFEAFSINESGSPINDTAYMRSALYPACYSGRELFSFLRAHKNYFPSLSLIFLLREVIFTADLADILHEDALCMPLLFFSLNRICCCPEAFYAVRSRKDAGKAITNGVIRYKTVCKAAQVLLRLPNRDMAIRIKIAEAVRSGILIRRHLAALHRSQTQADRSLLIRALWLDKSWHSRKLAIYCSMDWLYIFLQKLQIPQLIRFVRMPFHLLQRVRNRKKELDAPFSYAQKKILLIGAPQHGNLGDHAIAVASLRFFRENFPEALLWEIPISQYRSMHKQLARYISPADLIVILGGGWLGNVWPQDEKTVQSILRKYPQNRIIVLPQTIYYTVSQKSMRQFRSAQRIYAAHKQLTLCVREKASFAVAQTLCKDVLLAPDMCLYLNETEPVQERENVLLGFRSDREKTLEFSHIAALETWLLEKGLPFRYTTTVYDKPIPLSLREAALKKKFQEFRSARLVITDRLHTALFALITGTPCIAFDNLTHKVSGVRATLDDPYGFQLVKDSTEAIEAMELFLAQPCNELLPSQPSFEALYILLKKNVPIATPAPILQE